MSAILPRFIRLKDAPHYLGMDKNRFNAEVRPCLVVVPIGIQGLAVDRLDLDAWADDYKSRNGRQGTSRNQESAIWDAKPSRGSKRGAVSGTSTNVSKDMADFARALEKVKEKRQRRT